MLRSLCLEATFTIASNIVRMACGARSISRAAPPPHLPAPPHLQRQPLPEIRISFVLRRSFNVKPPVNSVSYRHHHPSLPIGFNARMKRVSNKDNRNKFAQKMGSLAIGTVAYHCLLGSVQKKRKRMRKERERKKESINLKMNNFNIV